MFLGSMLCQPCCDLMGFGGVSQGGGPAEHCDIHCAAGDMWQLKRCFFSRSPLGWSCVREMQEKMHCRQVRFPYSWASLCPGFCAGGTHTTSERYGCHVGFLPLSPSVLPCALFLEHWLMSVFGGAIRVRHMPCKSCMPYGIS